MPWGRGGLDGYRKYILIIFTVFNVGIHLNSILFLSLRGATGPVNLPAKEAGNNEQSLTATSLPSHGDFEG